MEKLCVELEALRAVNEVLEPYYLHEVEGRVLWPLYANDLLAAKPCAFLMHHPPTGYFWAHKPGLHAENGGLWYVVTFELEDTTATIKQKFLMAIAAMELALEGIKP